MTAERTIATGTHGRYLVDPAEGSSPRPLIVGLHGYGEQASIQLERLRAVRGSASMTLASIQALHRFYRRDGQDIAANWMTREDRELMIVDNIAYVDLVVDAVEREFHPLSQLVFAGFSQGASMAYRAATLGKRRADVIALGGDIPPELGTDVLARLPRVLMGWGVRDRFFNADVRGRDERRLADAGVPVSIVRLDTGHDWIDDFSQAAADWLRVPA